MHGSMTKVSNKTADLVGVAIIKVLNPLKAMFKTRIYDNSKKISGHASIYEALCSTDYFAQPFASLERGSNEIYGLLRQYMPKKRKMANITDGKLR